MRHHCPFCGSYHTSYMAVAICLYQGNCFWWYCPCGALCPGECTLANHLREHKIVTEDDWQRHAVEAALARTAEQ